MYNPSDQVRPVVESYEELMNNVDSIVTQYGKLIRNPDYNRLDIPYSFRYLVPLRFQGTDANLMVISNDGYEYNQIVLHNVTIYDLNPCMEMVLEEDCTASVEQVSIHGHCELPDIRKGTWILMLVDAICRNIGIRSVSLIDASNITYADRRTGELEEITLPLLRAFQGKDTWYSTFGFTHGSTEWYRFIDYMRNTAATEILELMESSHNSPIPYLHVYPYVGESMSSYMVRLLDLGEVKDYALLQEELLNTVIFDGTVRVSQIIRRIREHTKDYMV